MLALRLCGVMLDPGEHPFVACYGGDDALEDSKYVAPYLDGGLQGLCIEVGESHDDGLDHVWGWGEYVIHSV